jgi:hypothetical protein
VQLPPNTYVSIFRDTALDGYGDPTDVNTDPHAVAVPAVITSTSRTTQDPATGTPRQVTKLTCVLPRGTDVRDDDRLLDTATGAIYTVASVNVGTSYGFAAGVIATLSAVGA